MLRRNMTSAECQISDPKGRYLVFTLLFFQMPMMKTQGLNTKIITKKPKSARNCESRASIPAPTKPRTTPLLVPLRASKFHRLDPPSPAAAPPAAHPESPAGTADSPPAPVPCSRDAPPVHRSDALR